MPTYLAASCIFKTACYINGIPGKNETSLNVNGCCQIQRLTSQATVQEVSHYLITEFNVNCNVNVRTKNCIFKILEHKYQSLGYSKKLEQQLYPNRVSKSQYMV